MGARGTGGVRFGLKGCYVLVDIGVKHKSAGSICIEIMVVMCDRVHSATHRVMQSS